MTNIVQVVCQTVLRDGAFPILVLYNTKLKDSVTYQTFLASSCHDGRDSTMIAVYDNSTDRQVDAAEETHLFAYKHDPANTGIAEAYNWALDLAKSNGFSWLLLLDQDTVLPVAFIKSSLTQTIEYKSNYKVVALVPTARSGGSVVSPMRVRFCGLTPLPIPSLGIQSDKIMAINSGTIIRCSFLDMLGGFDRSYWLDYLDHWFFAQVYLKGFNAAVTECQIMHDLSAMRPYAHSIERYESIIGGEIRFVFAMKSRAYRVAYAGRLFCRTVKQLIFYRRPDLAAATLRRIWRLGL